MKSSYREALRAGIRDALLREAGQLDEARLGPLEEEVAREVEAAVAFAEAGTWEPAEELTRLVYREEGIS
jgi:TPP-dependent pyruvate/acetoin dehydrogenase alpha subunit